MNGTFATVSESKGSVTNFRNKVKQKEIKLDLSKRSGPYVERHFLLLYDGRQSLFYFDKN